MVGRWVGDDDGDAGFGASVSFKEFFVCSQSSVHRYEDVENFHIGGNCGKFFGNNLTRKFGYRPGIKYKSYFKGRFTESHRNCLQYESALKIFCSNILNIICQIWLNIFMVDCHSSNIAKLKKNISSSSSCNHKDYNLVLGGFGPKGANMINFWLFHIVRL